jgi:hypothetical protein
MRLLCPRLCWWLVGHVDGRRHAITLQTPVRFVVVTRTDPAPHAEVRSGIIGLLGIGLVANSTLTALTGSFGKRRSKITIERFGPAVRSIALSLRAFRPRWGRWKMHIHSSMSLSILSI